MVKIRLLITSDSHGQWQQHPDIPDYSLKNTAQLIKKLKKDAIKTLQFDLGDFIQGSAMTSYTSQVSKSATPFARMMNELDYDYQIIGNHEFNYGMNYQNSALDILNAKILCSNIVEKKTNKPYKGRAYDVIEIDGYKIGIIGATTHYIPHWELPENYEGLIFLDAFDTVKKYAQFLRPQVDLLVVAYHGGFEADLDSGEALEALTGENQGYKMINEIPEIDLLLTGHQHRQICQSFNHSFVIQPGYGGEKVGEVIVSLADGQSPIIEGRLLSFTSCQPIEDISALEPEYTQSIHWLSEVLGNAPIRTTTRSLHQARIEGHPFAEFLTRLMLLETGADFAGVSLLNEHFVEFQGNVTRGDLLTIYPYYNQIAFSQVTGQDLYDMMEHNFAYFIYDFQGNIIVNPSYIHPKPKHYNYDLYTGLKAEVDLNQPIGKRIIKLTEEKTQKEIDKQHFYHLALTQYRAVGGGDYSMFTKKKIVNMIDKDMVQLIIEGLKEMTDLQWMLVNNNYSHIEWTPFTKN
ncbi:bifunctional metallophosphatase/5'-nucleotidase [Facklamia miroungae]|uniref:2',3'-cyclic-nucleotide 2'-phosphodiesterase / 3'-nucleotidase n=1 Tax=Facklamia miroungae TaxID=120956 RepID=A0A1G7V2V5_9LACT|nr:bifunctional UDP-sugar hydrolase/5'-nucleotidase [Facklamia miroungae]NKZ30236.1 bifunctional metallophosphatase/5'-nucleotidase [Facklamia miroungae]SDG54057.1 2',3'-cyclic-nucleotide 2'-phosphodiesterase / 3'-nucleotidase [Facklamia miroungae]